MDTKELSRQQMLVSPFMDELEQFPHLSGIVHHHNYGDNVRVPGVTISISGGEERLDHPGDSWEFVVEFTARRKPGEYEVLDRDAMAIQQVTSSSMAGDPNISLLIAEEESTSSWGTEGKARTFTMSVPMLVVFS